MKFIISFSLFILLYREKKSANLLKILFLDKYVMNYNREGNSCLKSYIK